LFTEMSELWKMLFDGTSQKNRVGARIIFITPKEKVLSFAFSLTECCSNNMVKYQALILKLGMVVNIKIPRLKVFENS
jgi:hypothetical protein